MQPPPSVDGWGRSSGVRVDASAHGPYFGGMISLVKRPLYAAVDTALLRRGIRRRVNDEQVRLAPRWARYYPSDYEPEKQRFLRQHCQPGSTVLDLGAHIGLYTVLMARYVGGEGRVLAFEPTPETRRHLRRTIRLNHLGNVDIHEEAVSASTGAAFLNDTGDPVSNANSLAPIQRTRSQLAVRATSLDDLVATANASWFPGRVSCIKIDIEGAEVDALQGATTLLERDRPALAIEIHPAQLHLLGREPVELWDLLDAAGYVLMDGDQRLSRVEVERRQAGCYETQAIFSRAERR